MGHEGDLRFYYAETPAGALACVEAASRFISTNFFVHGSHVLFSVPSAVIVSNSSLSGTSPCPSAVFRSAGQTYVNDGAN